ncbi:DNA mismatch repair protein Mlh1 [Podospora australis]|uniref:DNA mismatch repair protein Mlh1 n=1 Tax=Podospora australis TaxID=1536484 RepID=A0AAN6X520_9PEZI|nr:DNA mismatch repair protein Mlh1 [Podospora australis]
MSDEMDVDNSPRGAKRKANEIADDGNDVNDTATRRRIQALDQDVVNKIAAGEIIVAPVNALKELMENSVDAGAASLEILVKDGGLKLLQVTDNGCGIEKEDLPILCERFTTSKLQKFEDLQTIATYGFRGEALASISHIAHLTVTTKTKDSSCAWRAVYEGGKLTPAKPGQSADPKPVAGRQGTQITVEDLFYTIPTRQRAFRSTSDEYSKIIDMVRRYAVHCPHVGFSCKKHGESSATIAIPAHTSRSDRIRRLYGGSVANGLTEFSTSDDQLGFKASGFATNANYSAKKTTFLLFINHRCVESFKIRKAIEQTYASFLPKNSHPFVYLSLEIDPRKVDVNVHPTKQEVHFLNEDETIQAVCEHLRSELAQVDASRTFLTQTLLPGGARLRITQPSPTPAPGQGSSNTRRTPARNETSLVRTDTNMRKITSMLPPAAGTSRAQPSHGPADTEKIHYEEADDVALTSCRLLSVRALREAVREDIHYELTDILANHTFVGIIDEWQRIAAIQSGVKLYTVDYGRLCFEYFYQVGLTAFGNFGTAQFNPPLNLRELLRQAVDAEKKRNNGQQDSVDEEDNEIIELVADQLIERREMLSEYFSLEISPTGELTSLPILTRGYSPALSKLPRFLLRLGPMVDWTAEQACFETFLRELADFYVPERLPPPPTRKPQPVENNDTNENETVEEEGAEEDTHLTARRRQVRWALENVLFPAFKSRLIGTNSLMKECIKEIADLKGLYRVFERC